LNTAAPSTFEDLEADVMARFAQGEFDAAIDLLDAHADNFSANRANTAYLRACLETRRGDETRAIAVLRDALDDGLWYSEPILRQSPSLQPLQGRDDYEALVIAFADRTPAEAAAAAPLVARPEGEPRGLLVAFHGNGQSARHALTGWEPMVAEGWVVAAPTSSQMLHSAGAVWDDAATARADVRRQAEAISRVASSDGPIIVAGFSLGGDVALWAALSGTLPTRRLVVIGPPAFLVDDPDWPNLLGAAPGLSVRVLLGEEDQAVEADGVEALVQSLASAGASVVLRRQPGLAHVLPPIEMRRTAIEELLASSS
jgi:predicted esterase